MAEKTMLITLKLVVSDLGEDELQQHAKDGECEIDELPQVDEVEPDEIAASIALMLEEDEVQRENIWAGSGSPAYGVDLG